MSPAFSIQKITVRLLLPNPTHQQIVPFASGRGMTCLPIPCLQITASRLAPPLRPQRPHRYHLIFWDWDEHAQVPFRRGGQRAATAKSKTALRRRLDRRGLCAVGVHGEDEHAGGAPRRAAEPVDDAPERATTSSSSSRGRC